MGYSPRGLEESDTTERLNNDNRSAGLLPPQVGLFLGILFFLL